MDSSYIKPFIASAQNVFQMMLQLPVEIGEPTRKQPGKPSYDVSGIIGLSGDVEGTVVLSFPTKTAERVVSLFAGEDLTQAHEDFADAVGELVNMISGGAKAQFEGKQVSIACPSVIVGQNHLVLSRKDVLCIELPCSCDCGEFSLEVSMRRTGGGNGAAEASAHASAGG